MASLNMAVPANVLETGQASGKAPEAEPAKERSFPWGRPHSSRPV